LTKHGWTLDLGGLEHDHKIQFEPTNFEDEIDVDLQLRGWTPHLRQWFSLDPEGLEHNRKSQFEPTSCEDEIDEDSQVRDELQTLANPMVFIDPEGLDSKAQFELNTLEDNIDVVSQVWDEPDILKEVEIVADNKFKSNNF